MVARNSSANFEQLSVIPTTCCHLEPPNADKPLDGTPKNLPVLDHERCSFRLRTRQRPKKSAIETSQQPRYRCWQTFAGRISRDPGCRSCRTRARLSAWRSAELGFTGHFCWVRENSLARPASPGARRRVECPCRAVVKRVTRPDDSVAGATNAEQHVLPGRHRSLTAFGPIGLRGRGLAVVGLGGLLGGGRRNLRSSRSLRRGGLGRNSARARCRGCGGRSTRGGCRVGSGRYGRRSTARSRNGVGARGGRDGGAAATRDDRTLLVVLVQHRLVLPGRGPRSRGRFPSRSGFGRASFGRPGLHRDLGRGGRLDLGLRRKNRGQPA